MHSYRQLHVVYSKGLFITTFTAGIALFTTLKHSTIMADEFTLPGEVKECPKGNH
jgi:hypothetical protein